MTKVRFMALNSRHQIVVKVKTFRTNSQAQNFLQKGLDNGSIVRVLAVFDEE